MYHGWRSGVVALSVSEKETPVSEFREFVDDYYRRFVETLATFDRAPLEGIVQVFEHVQQQGGTLWVA